MQEFLKKYKQLETILNQKEHPMTVLQYEETLSADDMEHLRICRQIRNYVQHHADGTSFLSATDRMKSFLDELMLREAAKTQTAKDRLYRLSPLTPDMALTDVLKRYGAAKRHNLPVVDKNGKYLGTMKLLTFVPIFSGNRSSTKLKSIISANDVFGKHDKQPKTVHKEDAVNDPAMNYRACAKA